MAKLFRGRKANVVVTSPPYATRGECDPSSGFRPVAPENHVDWFRDATAAVASVLDPTGTEIAPNPCTNRAIRR